MLRMAMTPIRRGSRRSRAGLLAALVVTGTAALLAAFAGGAPAGAAAGRTTHFAGQITGGSGRYANLRGSVRLVLHASTVAVVTPGPGTQPIGFTLTVTGPSCSGQHFGAPRRCASVHGTVIGTALAARHNPDVGTSFALSGHGRVAPLGAVSVSGTTRGLGFIARGRFPLTLLLRTGSGRLTINAQGPLVNGFSSPF